MALFSTASRTIVIKARRETIGLVVAASAMAFALAYTVHSRPVAPTPPPIQKEWAGDLAGGAPDTTVTPRPFRSADLVIPNAQLALPVLPTRPAVKRVCDDATCPKAPLPPPVRRQATRPEAIPLARKDNEPSLIATLNPLNHVPSLSTMGKPFTYAGDVVSGWIKRF